MKILVVVGWGGVMWDGLFDYSVKPCPDLSRLRLSLVRLVTRPGQPRLGLAMMVTRLARSRTRLFKARARSLTILYLEKKHSSLNRTH